MALPESLPESLLNRVQAALDAGVAISTETLQALLLETGAEKCWRRPRILNLLAHYARLHSPLPMSHSTTHRFKADFSHADFSGASIEVNGETKIVTAHNLSDEDVPLLIQYGYGHLIQALPKSDNEPEDLHKLLKPALQARYKDATKTEADDKLTKEDLIKAIQAAETTK